MASAQGPGIQTSGAGWRSGLLRDYKYQELAPIDLANSGRLEALLRSGNIYLSLATRSRWRWRTTWTSPTSATAP